MIGSRKDLNSVYVSIVAATHQIVRIDREDSGNMEYELFRSIVNGVVGSMKLHDIMINDDINNRGSETFVRSMYDISLMDGPYTGGDKLLEQIYVSTRPSNIAIFIKSQ